jgi:hypothetical protein
MREFNQQLVANDPLVKEIYDRILEDNGQNVEHALNQACAEIAELYIHLDNVAKKLSSGFVRKPPNDND